MGRSPSSVSETCTDRPRSPAPTEQKRLRQHDPSRPQSKPHTFLDVHYYTTLHRKDRDDPITIASKLRTEY